jgi:outer membrane receptor protein involved in Fe transport
MPSPRNTPFNRIAIVPVVLATVVGQALAQSPPDPMVTELPPVEVRGSGQSTPGPRIDPGLGVTSHTIGPAEIATVPGGSNASISTVLQRLPGVVQDSYGEIHIRGEHGNAQYRINGFTLPEELEGFGQQLNTQFVRSATLLTGTLPAQYGLKLSGIVDITTKTGADLQGGEAGVYGGSFGTIRPYYSIGGTTGNLEYFGNLTYERNNLGIENPTPSASALHDRTTQYSGFGGATYRIDDQSKLILLFGASNKQFQIPDTPGQSPQFTLANAPPIPSGALNENQNEQRYFAVLGYERHFDNLTIRPSLFYSYDRILYTPDAVGDLLYQGVAGRTLNQLSSFGPQLDATYALGDRHLIGFGGRVSFDGYNRRDSTLVFPTDTNGNQTSSTPATINDTDRKAGHTASVYLQDQWSVTPKLTVNYGLRYDNYYGYSKADQISPRVNAVYAVTADLSVHAGYARYFTPPGLEYITAATVARFANTTNAASAPNQTAPYPERAHYFDIGALQKFGDLTVSLDGFYKLSRGGIDLGQFGNAVILVPFNYDHGHTYGAEVGLRYTHGPWDAGLSFSYVKARAIDITSNQTAFPANELAYIAAHTITLDHDQPFTVAINGGYRFNQDNTRVFGDFLLGSGLRYGFANFGTLDPHYTFNAGIEHRIPLNNPDAKVLKLRLDVTNILDQKAKLRDGSGVGIAAAQFLPRRGVFGTVAVEF